MNIHRRAKTTPESRVLLVRRVLAEGRSRRQAAEAFGLSVRTVQKWLRRYREEGEEGLRDRSSRPHRCPGQSSASAEATVLELLVYPAIYKLWKWRTEVRHLAAAAPEEEALPAAA